MKDFFGYVSKHKVIVIIVLLVLGATYYGTHRPSPSPFQTTTVKRGDVIQQVSVTGKVSAESAVDLAFEVGGKVASIPTPVGTHVKKGDVLVRLDTGVLAASRAQAKANLDLEAANLAALKTGARPEDIAVSLAQVKSAEANLHNAQNSYLDKLNLSFDAISDAIYAKTDPLFTNPRTSNAKLSLQIADQRLVTTVESERISLGKTMQSLSTDQPSLESGVDDALTALKKYLDNLLVGIATVQPTPDFSQVSIDAAKANILAARTGVTNAQTALLGVEDNVRVAQNALDVAQSQYALKSAGPTKESITAEEAKIASMSAAVSSIDAQIAKTTLLAPMSGVVTKQNAKYGETVSPGIVQVSLISDGIWKIEANVPEVDVTKLKLGDHAKISFDAYGTDVLFDATTATIDPAETVIGGVSTYKVTLLLDKVDDRIRSGMTANIDIDTNRSVGVLLVPLRAVLTKENGDKVVRIPLPDGLSAREVAVTLGLRGSDGNIEIKDGLTEGETIVTYENQ